MAAIFGGGEIFLKIANITFLRYPVGRKFRQNRSIDARLRSVEAMQSLQFSKYFPLPKKWRPF